MPLNGCMLVKPVGHSSIVDSFDQQLFTLTDSGIIRIKGDVLEVSIVIHAFNRARNLVI